MIKVAIVEDNRVVRDVLNIRLDEQTDFTISYSAANGSIEDLRDSSSQILLLDVGLEGDDSLQLAQRIRSEVPGIRVIVMDLPPLRRMPRCEHSSPPADRSTSKDLLSVGLGYLAVAQ